jgi:hypothetical protein
MTFAEKPSILNTPTISEQFFFLMLKYPSSTNTVHFGYYKGNKKQKRKLLATKFEDYFSHNVSNTTFQQTTHYTGKKLQNQIA